MTTTADLVLDHVRRHGRIADLAALARDAGRPPKAVLKALENLKMRGRVTYVLWDMPIRVVGEPVVHREVKPSNEVEKGEPIAVDEAAHLEREVVQPAEAPNTVAKGDMDDAAEQPAEVVHSAPQRRRGLTAALLEHLRTRSGERPEPGAFGVDERQIGVTLAHLRKRGVLSYPASKGGRGHRLDWSTIRVLEGPTSVSTAAPPSPSSNQAPENGLCAESSGPSAPRRRQEPSVGEEGTPAAPGASSRPLAAEAFHVVDRRKRRLRGFAHIEDACRSQHKDLPHGYGVVRVSDGKWMSRLMPAGWGQPKADEDDEQESAEP